MSEYEINKVFKQLGINKYVITSDGLVDIYTDLEFLDLNIIYRNHIMIGTVVGNIYGSWSSINTLLGFPHTVAGIIYLEYCSLFASAETFDLLYQCECGELRLSGYFKFEYGKYYKIKKRFETINSILHG